MANTVKQTMRVCQWALMTLSKGKHFREFLTLLVTLFVTLPVYNESSSDNVDLTRKNVVSKLGD